MDVRPHFSGQRQDAGTAPDTSAAQKPVREGGVSESDAKRLDSALRQKAGQPGYLRSESGDGENIGGGMAPLFSQAVGQLAGHEPVFTTPHVPVPAESAASAPLPGMTETRCGELVERILATPPSADGSAEVRITIDKPWLPDTEIRLTLSPAGRLDVDFRADSVDAQRFLAPNLDSLRDRLAERCAGGVAVRLTESSRENENDGRGRNRRSVIEEWDGE